MAEGGGSVGCKMGHRKVLTVPPKSYICIRKEFLSELNQVYY
jgi:hypothetical protein